MKFSMAGFDRGCTRVRVDRCASPGRRRRARCPTQLVLLFFGSLAAGADDQQPTLPQKPPPGRPALTSTASITQARTLMAAAWCPRHGDSAACTSFNFLQKLRQSKTAERKKDLLAERQARMTSMTADEKKTTQTQMKEGHRAMYTHYCTVSSPTHRSDACRNVVLKAIYGVKKKKDAARDQRLDKFAG